MPIDDKISNCLAFFQYVGRNVFLRKLDVNYSKTCMRVITAHYSLMDKQIAKSLVHLWKEESTKVIMAAERKWTIHIQIG